MVECYICEKDVNNFELFEDEKLCNDCFDDFNVNDDNTNNEDNDLPESDILDDCIEFFYDCNDEFSFNYFLNRFSKSIVKKYRLGFAPCDDSLYYFLSNDKGYSDEEILSTGLFYENSNGFIDCLWKGRFVFPYFNENGEVAYCIARESEKTEDFLSGKYVKPAHTKDYCDYEEIVFGKNTIENNKDNNTLLIAEGIADALKSIEVLNYPVLSPVTTQFKEKHIPIIHNIVDKYNFSDVVFIPDIETPSVDDINRYGDDAVGEGLKGALITSFKFKQKFDTSDYNIKTLKLRSDKDKIDLEEYLQYNDENDFKLLLDDNTKKSEKYNFYQTYKKERKSSKQNRDVDFDNVNSGLYELKLTDVAPVNNKYRGENPIEHIGESKNYFVVSNDGETAYDHKSKQTYNALNYILHKIGERQRHNIEGQISDEEIFKIYKYVKNKNILNDDKVPSKVLKYVLKDSLSYNKDLTPPYYQIALDLLNNKYDININQDSSYKDETYWEYRPECYCISKKLHYNLSEEDKIHNIEFKEVSDNKILWKTENMDFYNDSLLYYYIVKNNIDIEEIDKYYIYKLSRKEYYNTVINMLQCDFVKTWNIDSIDFRVKKYLSSSNENIDMYDNNMNSYDYKKAIDKFKKDIKKE